MANSRQFSDPRLAIGSEAIAVARTMEHAVVRARHGADPIAGEGEDVDADAVADASGFTEFRPILVVALCGSNVI